MQITCFELRKEITAVYFSNLLFPVDSLSKPEWTKTDNKLFKDFFFPNNGSWKVDDVMYNEPLAKTLEEIALQGADVFYHGSLAQQLAKEVIFLCCHILVYIFYISMA